MDKNTFIAGGRLHYLKPGEVDAWLQFLAEAFAKKGPNMLEVFKKKLDNDIDFHCGDVLLLGTIFDIIQAILILLQKMQPVAGLVQYMYHVRRCG